jgi:hypothetical protein
MRPGHLRCSHYHGPAALHSSTLDSHPAHLAVRFASGYGACWRCGKNEKRVCLANPLRRPGRPDIEYAIAATSVDGQKEPDQGFHENYCE